MEEFVLKGPADNSGIPKKCFGEILLHFFNQQNPKDIAFIEQSSGRTVSYGEALRQTLKLALSLQQFGVTQEDVIAIVSENNVDYYLPVFAGLLIGAAVNPLNPTYTPRELKHAVDITKPKLIFVSENALDAVLNTEPTFPRRNVIVFGDGIDETTPFAKFLETNANKNEDLRQNDFDPSEHTALILLSSGTTGLPKCVMITHENLRAGIVALSDPDFGVVKKGAVALGLLPFFHLFGIFVFFMSAMGITTVIMKKFKPQDYLATISAYKINIIFVVPSMVLFLAKTPLLDKYDISSLTDIYCAAAPLNTDIQSLTENRLNRHIRQMYGLTEVSGAVTIIPKNLQKLGSSGILVSEVTAKIVDPETKQPCGPNQFGELCFKGPCVMKGYMANEVATAETIDEDGFLHTGDIGYYDDDKYFYVVDRIKDLIKYKGFQVAPAELEAILLSHAAVKDAAVIGIPDERAGEVPRAFVVRNPSVHVTEEELIDFVGDRVSISKKLYGGVQFVEELPKTSSGKIKKKDIREAVRKGSIF